MRDFYVYLYIFTKWKLVSVIQNFLDAMTTTKKGGFVDTFLYEI